AALALSEVTVAVDDGRSIRHVLDRVSVAVEVGELVAVMGPSGAGKSTLVDVACGLVMPTGGSVGVLGEVPSGVRHAWWAKRRRRSIGVVHQRLNLLGGLTALANVALAADLGGSGRAEATRLATEAL